MSDKTLLALSWTPTITQPRDVRRLPESERDSLIVTATQVDGQWVLLSLYADDIWHLDGFTSNRPLSQKRLDFSRVPPALRAVVKAMLYRYILRGRGVGGRPRGSSTLQMFNDAMPFLRHLEMLKLGRMSAVTPMICAAYVASCKAHLQAKRSKGKPLSPRGWEHVSKQSKHSMNSASTPTTRCLSILGPRHPEVQWQGLMVRTLEVERRR